jgi:hypothetical protein
MEVLKEHIEKQQIAAFDNFWPILEGFEEIAAKICDDKELAEQFAKLYVDICLKMNNNTVESAMSWLLNELSERGENSYKIAEEVAKGFLRSDKTSAKRIASLIINIKSGEFASLVNDQEVVKTYETVNKTYEDILNLLEEAKTSIEQIQSLRDIDIFMHSKLQKIQEMCYANPNGEQGIVLLAMMKEMLKMLCNKIKEAKNLEKQSTNIVQKLIYAMILPVNNDKDRSVFIAVDSCEVIRDKFVKEFGKAVVNLLLETGSSDTRVAIGLQVCIAELYEEVENNETTIPIIRINLRNNSLNYVRFFRRSKQELDVYYSKMIKVIKRHPEICFAITWLNNRLDLHQEIYPEILRED